MKISRFSFQMVTLIASLLLTACGSGGGRNAATAVGNWKGVRDVVTSGTPWIAPATMHYNLCKDTLSHGNCKYITMQKKARIFAGFFI